MKKSMVLSALILVIATITFVGTTIAYFSDTKQSANTFTSGNVEIVMTESAVKPDAIGNLVADPSKPRIEGTPVGVLNDYGKIYPGQSVCKDPIVKNIGSENAWIAVKVTLTDGMGDLRKVIGYNPDVTDLVDIELLLSGGLLDERVHVGMWNGLHDVCYNDRYAMVQVPTASKDVYEFYFFMLAPLSTGETVNVFDSLTVPAEWDNLEMKELSELKIEVTAYAVQTFGFDSCYLAMTTAFQSEFQFN